MKLKGRVAIITGGGRGIGKNIGLAYAREGAKVVIAARTSAEIEATAREIQRCGGASLAVHTDVSDYSSVENLVGETLCNFSQIDILVNSAGVQGPIGSIGEVDREKWVDTLMINLVGTFYCCRAVLPSMKGQQRGKIINLSGGGSVSPRANFSAYSASKAAVVRFTETLAEELTPWNIQVNTMGPGATRTRITEQIAAQASRAGPKEARQAEDILRGGGVDPERQAALAIFLASDDSNGLTGRMLHTNDNWPSLIGRIDEIMATDLYTVQRIQPVK